MGTLFSRLKLALIELSSLERDYRTVQERLLQPDWLPPPTSLPSYWMDPPSSIATIQPAKLWETADVVIIGSGITGTAVARTLLDYAHGGSQIEKEREGEKRRKVNVVMLEARETCSGATGRNGGHVNPPLFHDYSSLKQTYGPATARQIIRFRLSHLPHLRSVAETENALEYSQIRNVEGLDVYYGKEEFEKAKEMFAEWRSDMPQEAKNSFVVEGEEASKKFGVSESAVGCIVSPAGAAHPYRLVTSVLSNLLKRHPDNFQLSTRTPCTSITAPSSHSSLYTVHTPRGTITTPHIIHCTNGYTPHLIAPLRTKIVPFRGLMTAQRPGQSLNAKLGALASASVSIPVPAREPELERAAVSDLDSDLVLASRAHVFHTGVMGYDYLTQLPAHPSSSDGREGSGGELMFGGGAVDAYRFRLDEVGNINDGGYDRGVAAHVGGALPEHFGRGHWGAEAAAPLAADGGDVDGGESGMGRSPWGAGRVKALWSGVLGISMDGQPWVGRLPPKVSGRPEPKASLTSTLPASSLSLSAKEISALRTSADPLTAPPGEWISAGYTGEGMVHAWRCGEAVAYMVLGADAEREMKVEEWLPDCFKVTEARWKKASLEKFASGR